VETGGAEVEAATEDDGVEQETIAISAATLAINLTLNTETAEGPVEHEGDEPSEPEAAGNETPAEAEPAEEEGGAALAVNSEAALTFEPGDEAQDAEPDEGIAVVTEESTEESAPEANAVEEVAAPPVESSDAPDAPSVQDGETSDEEDEPEDQSQPVAESEEAVPTPSVAPTVRLRQGWNEPPAPTAAPTATPPPSATQAPPTTSPPSPTPSPTPTPTLTPVVVEPPTATPEPA
jgi:hypothetical protein